VSGLEIHVNLHDVLTTACCHDRIES